MFNTRALLGLLGLSLWAGVAADQNDPALDQLFLQLAHTGVKQESDRISAEIWERWARIDNAKASAWLERGIRAMSNQH